MPDPPRTPPGAALDRYHALVEVRSREFNGRALLYGETVAREWLSQQPEITLDTDSNTRQEAQNA